MLQKKLAKLKMRTSRQADAEENKIDNDLLSKTVAEEKIEGVCELTVKSSKLTHNMSTGYCKNGTCIGPYRGGA